MKQKNSIAYLYLFITFFCWGSYYVASKYVLGSMPPALLCLIRYGLAVLPLLWMARKKLVRVERCDIKYFLAVGVYGYYGTVLLNLVGVKFSSAAVGSLVNAINPVAIALMAALVLKERITPIKALCLVLSIIGTYIVSQGAADRSELVGILFVLASVVCWSVASVYNRKMSQKYGPLIVVLYGMLISLIFHAPTAIISVVQAGGVHISWQIWLWIIVIAFGCTTLPHMMWSKSLSLLEASTCSLFYPLQAFWSCLLGALFLHEQMGTQFFLGSVLIVAVVVLNWWDGQRRAKLDAKNPVA